MMFTFPLFSMFWWVGQDLESLSIPHSLADSLPLLLHLVLLRRLTGLLKRKFYASGLVSMQPICGAFVMFTPCASARYYETNKSVRWFR